MIVFINMKKKKFLLTIVHFNIDFVQIDVKSLLFIFFILLSPVTTTYHSLEPSEGYIYVSYCK